MKYILITAENSLRQLHYEAALRTFWNARRTDVQLHVIPWIEVARHDGLPERITSSPANGILRIDSPGGDIDTVNELIKAGARQAHLSAPPLLPRPEAVPDTHLVFRGLNRILRGLHTSLKNTPLLHPAVDPQQLILPFDKNSSLDLLESHGIPCAERLSSSAASLLNDMRRADCPRVFVKLAFGACGSGILLLDLTRSEPIGLTTVVKHDHVCCNLSRLKEVNGRELLETLTWLFDQQATVQKEIPKTQVAGNNFDVRIVMVHGEVAATVFRVSQQPVTNLHLGGWRGDPEQCRAMIPRRQWLDALDACIQAADVLRLPICGIDVAFERRTGSPFILEANSFGDFFPNWTDRDGRSIHELEIEATAAKLGFLR